MPKGIYSRGTYRCPYNPDCPAFTRKEVLWAHMAAIHGCIGSANRARAMMGVKKYESPTTPTSI